MVLIAMQAALTANILQKMTSLLSSVTGASSFFTVLSSTHISSLLSETFSVSFISPFASSTLALSIRLTMLYNLQHIDYTKMLCYLQPLSQEHL